MPPDPPDDDRAPKAARVDASPTSIRSERSEPTIIAKLVEAGARKSSRVRITTPPGVPVLRVPTPPAAVPVMRKPISTPQPIREPHATPAPAKHWKQRTTIERRLLVVCACAIVAVVISALVRILTTRG